MLKTAKLQSFSSIHAFHEQNCLLLAWYKVTVNHRWYVNWNTKNTCKLEQLERLRSEDIPRRLMITHTIESNWIPSQKKTKSKLQIF